MLNQSGTVENWPEQQKIQQINGRILLSQFKN